MALTFGKVAQLTREILSKVKCMVLVSFLPKLMIRTAHMKVNFNMV
jgi:hypothetical protein